MNCLVCLLPLDSTEHARQPPDGPGRRPSMHKPCAEARRLFRAAFLAAQSMPPEARPGIRATLSEQLNAFSPPPPNDELRAHRADLVAALEAAVDLVLDT